MEEHSFECGGSLSGAQFLFCLQSLSAIYRWIHISQWKNSFVAKWNASETQRKHMCCWWLTLAGTHRLKLSLFYPVLIILTFNRLPLISTSIVSFDIHRFWCISRFRIVKQTNKQIKLLLLLFYRMQFKVEHGQLNNCCRNTAESWMNDIIISSDRTKFISAFLSLDKRSLKIYKSCTRVSVSVLAPQLVPLYYGWAFSNYIVHLWSSSMCVGVSVTERINENQMYWILKSVHSVKFIFGMEKVEDWLMFKKGMGNKL